MADFQNVVRTDFFHWVISPFPPAEQLFCQSLSAIELLERF